MSGYIRDPYWKLFPDVFASETASYVYGDERICDSGHGYMEADDEEEESECWL